MERLLKTLLTQCRVLTLLLLVTLSATRALGGGTDYHFKIKVVAAPTGAGTVYASKSSTTPTESNYKDSLTTDDWTVRSEQQAASTQAYLFAKANDGYTFVNWTNSTGTVVGSVKDITVYLSSSVSSERTDPQETYYANFVKIGWVTVSSSDETMGSVAIDNVTNGNGDKVTLTAKPYILYARFTGWKKNGEGELIKDNPLTIDVTEQAKYVAYFEDATEGVYCMVVNKPTSAYMNLGLNAKTEVLSGTDSRRCTRSLIILPPTNHSAPPLVLHVKGTKDGDKGLTNAIISAQGVTSSAIASSGNLDIKKYDDETFLIKGTYGGKSGYICGFANYGCKLTDVTYGEIGAACVYNQGNTIADEFKWYFNPLTEETMDEYYFGAEPNATMTENGKYYCSLYTSFPYKCYDGIKAYYVGGWTSDGNAAMKEITSGEVPSNTGVILECNDTTAKKNRLVPMLTEPAAISGNLLNGCIQLNGETQTAYDETTMRVFGMSSKGVIGFYKRAAAEDGTNNLTSNMAYLDISTRPSSTKSSVKMDFSGADDVSGIINIAPEKRRIVPQGWYDLQGRRLGERPTKSGIYIFNGKKIVVR